MSFENTIHLRNACYNSDINKVKLFLSTSTLYDWNDLLKIGCIVGSIEIVKLMIEKGADDLNRGLHESSYQGHIDIVKFLISHGANDWNDGLRSACYNGHIDIVKLMISFGANNWNDGLYTASSNGHIEIVKLMISHGANGVIDWNKALLAASFLGFIDIIKLMIEKGADEFDGAIKNSFNRNHLEILNILILKTKHIPEYCILSRDQLEFFYKSDVTSSIRYNNYFYHLKIIDGKVKMLCDDILIKDLLSIVLSY